MENHIHLLWQILPGHTPEAVQRDFLKYTAQRIKKDLQENHPQVLSCFRVNSKDREYQFWERNALSVELRSRRVFCKNQGISMRIRYEPEFVNYLKNINTLRLSSMKQELITGDFLHITMTDP